MNDEHIRSLIAVKKTILQPPKKNFFIDKTNHFCLHNNFTCVSTENKEDSFYVFLRKSTIIPEAFSIGLKYDKENILLLRVNGKHKHANKENKDTFNAFHVHTANEIQLSKGITNSFDAFQCKEYNSFTSALLFFCKTCGIIEIERYLASMCQISIEELL